jgi:hypothetical protein
VFLRSSPLHLSQTTLLPARPQPERRSEPRYLTPDLAEVTILAETSAPVVGQVQEVSRSGIRISMTLALRPGTQIQITFRRPTVILGEVRNCRRMGDAFHVGIKIVDVLISPNRHVGDDELEFYVSNKGLTEPEFFYVRQHFSECPACGRRLREREASGG